MYRQEKMQFGASPCRECLRRKPLCHDKCNAYQQYTLVRKQVSQKEREMRTAGYLSRTAENRRVWWR